MCRVPVPAPKRCSPAAAAVASFSSAAGTPNASSASVRQRHVHPARQMRRRDQHTAGRVERPARADPDARRSRATPTPDSSTALRPSSKSRSSPRSGPSAGQRRGDDKGVHAARGSTTPAASFVPPMSSASTCCAAAVLPRWRDCREPRPSALASLGRDSLDEEALEDREQDHHRQDRDHGARHDDLPAALPAAADPLLVEDRLQPERQRVERAVAQVDQRRQQVEPLRLQLEDDRRRPAPASRAAARSAGTSRSSRRRRSARPRRARAGSRGRTGATGRCRRRCRTRSAPRADTALLTPMFGMKASVRASVVSFVSSFQIR